MVRSERKFPKGFCSSCGIKIVVNGKTRICDHCKVENKKVYVQTRKKLAIKGPPDRVGVRVCLRCEREFLSEDIINNRLCRQCSGRSDYPDGRTIYT